MVQPLTAAKSLQPLSIAAHTAPLLTLWQEQMVALSGSASAPKAGAPPPCGRISAAGSAGRAMPFWAYCNRVS
ncbi:hypothetical protein D9M71_576400 [compost metagenome]